MTYTKPPLFANLPPTGKVTKNLCIALFAVSIIGSVTQRKLGFGVEDLLFSVDRVLELELWRLASYPFVVRSPFSLIISAAILWLFGRMFEAQWGARYFSQFLGFSWVGAALLAIPFSWLINLVMPFSDPGYAEGPGPGIDALLVSIAITQANTQILLGFVLPIRARTVIYIIIGFELLVGLQTGTSSLSLTLGGLAMGYLLTTGYWRPRHMRRELTLWRQKNKPTRPRNPRIYVVPPNKNN